MPKVKKVLLYVSVRVFDNEERKAKTEADLSKLREFCKSKGYEVSKEFIESRQNSKPEWLNLVNYVTMRIGEISHVFIADWDAAGVASNEFWMGKINLEKNYCEVRAVL